MVVEGILRSFSAHVVGKKGIVEGIVRPCDTHILVAESRSRHRCSDHGYADPRGVPNRSRLFCEFFGRTATPNYQIYRGAYLAHTWPTDGIHIPAVTIGGALRVESRKVVPMEIPRSLTKSYRSSGWHTRIASKPLAKKATLIDRLARLASPLVRPSVPLS
jgi:hypothetical protein